MTYDFNSLIEPNMEIGMQHAYRFWRYDIQDGIYHLKSWVFDMEWHPDMPMTGNPDKEDAGVHAYKTREDCMSTMGWAPSNLLLRTYMTDQDGVVFGTVNLWGVVWDHKRGYRAQFAKPTSFDIAYGKPFEGEYNPGTNENLTAIEMLRKRFFA